MDRPIFNSIMEKVRSGRSGGIVVYKLDRFARSLLGAMYTLAELGEHEAVLASATEPELDYTTPAGGPFSSRVHLRGVHPLHAEGVLGDGAALRDRAGHPHLPHLLPRIRPGPDRRLIPNDQASIMVEVYRRRGGRGESLGIAR